LDTLQYNTQESDMQDLFSNIKSFFRQKIPG